MAGGGDIPLAAVLYDDGAAADALLLGFARGLKARGVAVRGLVQLPPEQPGCGPEAPMCLEDLASGEVFPICQDLGAGAAGCRLDPHGLARAAARLRAEAERPSALLVISKFGKREAAGQGFRDEIAHALGEGRTVLTTVKRSLLADWQEFSGGMGRLLEARAAALEVWWAELRR